MRPCSCLWNELCSLVKWKLYEGKDINNKNRFTDSLTQRHALLTLEFILHKYLGYKLNIITPIVDNEEMLPNLSAQLYPYFQILYSFCSQ
jgi:D-hexose-6-phosphate mutarotase